MNKFIYKPNLSLREIRAGISDEVIQSRIESQMRKYEIESITSELKSSMQATSFFMPKMGKACHDT